MTHIYSFYLRWSVFRGENLMSVIMLKIVNVSLHSDIYGPISFKLCVMIEITERYIIMPVWISLTFIHSHRFMRCQKLVHSFSCKFHSLMKFSVLPQSIGLLKLFRTLYICIIDIQWKENSANVILWNGPLPRHLSVQHNSTVWFQFEWSWPYPRLEGCRNARNFAAILL